MSDVPSGEVEAIRLTDAQREHFTNCFRSEMYGSHVVNLFAAYESVLSALSSALSRADAAQQEVKELEQIVDKLAGRADAAERRLADVRHWFDEELNEAEQNMETSTFIEWLESGRALAATPSTGPAT